MILPGATIGILGGGQLGRMMAVAAAQLGYRCHVFTPERESVAGVVSAALTRAPWDDAAAMERFAADCDVITFEFENVPVGPLGPLEERLHPHPRALGVAQDRLNEKRFVEELGGHPASYAPVDSRGDLAAAVERISAPGILKTRREGYDGKGQWRIAERGDIEGIDLPQTAMIYEGLVRFECEFSVILVRSCEGEVRFWDSAENDHAGGILSTSTLPPRAIVGEQVEEARELARKVADALGYVGVLTLEFFATAGGPVFNEMAPRVHNSGHWTIEGAATSQFENHVRAILGLPLGDTATTAVKVEMINIIGDDVAGAHECLSEPGAHLHLYGKSRASAGRKMGHITRIAR